MAGLDLELFTTEELGDTSYLVASDGQAALVDPQRDAWRFLAAAQARGWRVTHVLETHVHNDYVSGALEARAATGAEIVAPARGGYEFTHRGADDGTAVEIGALRLTALATPGHTPEHLSWTVATSDPGPDGEPGIEAVFTGGSLLVGTAGRTDLLGPERTDELTRLQSTSLRKLAGLPPGVRVLPTHGSGSFCSAGPAAAARTSTIGDEAHGNPVVAALGGPGYRDALLGHLGRFPDYYARMAPINRRGPRVLGGRPDIPELDPSGLERAMTAGIRVIDARPRAAFAAGHVPGSWNIELDESFAAYVGWLLAFDAPLALVVPDPETEAAIEAVDQLLRIGFEHVVGRLAGGIDAWAESGRSMAAYPTTTMAEVHAETAAGAMPPLLDVRQPVEWRDEGVVPGARTIFVADLPAALAAGALQDLGRDQPITVACKAGSRAAIASSILDAAGYDVRLVARGGHPGWPARFAALGTDTPRQGVPGSSRSRVSGRRASPRRRR